MGATRSRRAFANYRDVVTDLIEAGEPFGAVEDVIEEVGELSNDEKAALWLFAFSLRDLTASPAIGA